MSTTGSWPATSVALIVEQARLGAARPARWYLPEGREPALAACFACFPLGLSGPGAAGDECWAAAALMVGGKLAQRAVRTGCAAAPYEPGLLALRQGAPLEAAVRALGTSPDVLLVDATGRDHPRRAGLALHLGAVLGLPTVGITHRPLSARGDWPADEGGASAPLRRGEEIIGAWVRTRPGRRPLAVHAAWRTDPATAIAVVIAATRRARTPEPLRCARQLARMARAGASRRTL
jgi:deoxyribonuclease V